MLFKWVPSTPSAPVHDHWKHLSVNLPLAFLSFLHFDLTLTTSMTICGCKHTSQSSQPLLKFIVSSRVPHKTCHTLSLSKEISSARTCPSGATEGFLGISSAVFGMKPLALHATHWEWASPAARIRFVGGLAPRGFPCFIMLFLLAKNAKRLQKHAKTTNYFRRFGPPQCSQFRLDPILSCKGARLELPESTLGTALPLGTTDIDYWIVKRE